METLRRDNQRPRRRRARARAVMAPAERQAVRIARRATQLGATSRTGCSPTPARPSFQHTPRRSGGNASAPFPRRPPNSPALTALSTTTATSRPPRSGAGFQLYRWPGGRACRYGVPMTAPPDRCGLPCEKRCYTGPSSFSIRHCRKAPGSGTDRGPRPRSGAILRTGDQ
jgi:hypothetical protein